MRSGKVARASKVSKAMTTVSAAAWENARKKFKATRDLSRSLDAKVAKVAKPAVGVIAWEDPPAVAGRQGAWAKLAALLKLHPGRWALIKEHSTASVGIQGLKRYGKFQIAQRSGKVYARWGAAALKKAAGKRAVKVRWRS